jgi:hypothetical protein
MLTKKVIFMSVQPDVPYFHWQVEVMIHNFIKVGINPNWIEVLWAVDGNPSPEVLKLAQQYSNVRFFFYPKRIAKNHGYIPILRPDSLEQHFERFPELRGDVILYHDSDIIFRELPDFDSMREDHYWYLSDTVSYIGARYIKSKSDELFKEMCEIAKIDPELVENNELNSGGAQYLMKGVTSEYWKYVKETSLELYRYMADRESKERTQLSQEELKTYNPVQKWCADMWAVLWGAWRSGAQVKLSKELEFSWGTSSLSDYDRHKIMHNAGVTNSNEGRLFYKGEFINKDPFQADFSNINPNTASAKYVEAILYAKQHR